MGNYQCYTASNEDEVIFGDPNYMLKKKASL